MNDTSNQTSNDLDLRPSPKTNQTSDQDQNEADLIIPQNYSDPEIDQISNQDPK